jgi:dephospho-CoA kinase
VTVRRIGLTGGIATGKSHVVTKLREHGVPVVDADVLSRESVAAGSPGLVAVAARFGPTILQADGTLDRARLGAIVFRDTEARRDLEAIVHPFVRQAIEAFFVALPVNEPFAVADVPLLYETGRQDRFDGVIVVACTPETQLERVMARGDLTREDAERRIASQWPIAEKVKRADHVVRTDGTYADTDAQVLELVKRLRREAGHAQP